MIVSIPLDENKTDVCIAFARAPYFMFHDTETGADAILPNPAADAQGGAGPKAAQFLADRKADILITVRCGENAAEVMKDAGIKIYKSAGGNASSDLAAFKENRLEILTRFHAGFHGMQ